MTTVVFTSLWREDEEYYREHLKGMKVLTFSQSIEELPEEVLCEAEVACVFVMDRVSSQVLEKMPRLKLLHTRSVGYDHIDIEECRNRGIVVTHLPEYSPSAVAQHAFALLLHLVRKLDTIKERVRRMDFSQSYQLMSRNLEDMTLGIIGTGRIGSLMARYALSFGMKVLAYDVVTRKDLLDLGVRYTSLEDLLRESDAVSLHVPYTPQTHHLLNASNMSLLKDGCIIINTSRGAVIDTKALYHFFREGKIGAVGLDVFEEEKTLILGRYRDGEGSSLLLKLLEMTHSDRVIITPHVAFLTDRAVSKIREETLRILRAYAEGDMTFISSYSVFRA
ncbi:D-isomer specific 2-hydroxyacid dehydrogenase NAD-binding protein [Thermocrinis albus DSM 14484]|uniref:D-isomer specific 2-hydroxyacid dehydrogenase NAD-binding protein n=1 Tax=Thermocrinis albus (strain DSM 14484 / JCM 11386 / HI 11/12) TaxID=638303 RepID=D3SNV8_THEAH|nr:hydroxyacid dehydrogenase [Thermocrinis albus]ADC88845.1 D-isomer specific 2-hydroxyacid dehydrogenase NAD-binding protein [Thermocrinis albus DSM 14484]